MRNLMMQRVIMRLWAAGILVAVSGMLAGLTPSALAQENLADFLYQVAREYRQAGQIEEAIHELRKALSLDPAHEPARRELHELESIRSEREQAIDAALAELEESARAVVEPATAAVGSAAVAPAVTTEPVLARVPRLPTAIRLVRAPDPNVNAVRWLYVFGRQGSTDYGALVEPQQVWVAIPQSPQTDVTIRILDADVRGRHDEMDGGWNTATVFRVYGGARELAARVLGPEERDGTTVEFGPFSLAQGERHGDQVLFLVEAEGLDGDDNNLFAIEVSPAHAELFTFSPAIRLARDQGERMRFFPAIPGGTTSLVIEENYDLDPDGGRITLFPMTRDGRRSGAIQIRPSGSGSWSRTEIEVPFGTDGTRWTYQITKATQLKGNMSFRLKDQRGRLLPIFFTRGRAIPRPAQPTVRPSGACNTFEFDASESTDADDETLAYRWDFGDGAIAEGLRVAHTYERPGDYRVVLTVTDPSGTGCCTDTEEQTVHVNVPPKAVFEIPAAACAGTSVRFSAAQSSDAPGEVLRYAWDFGDGATAEGMEVTHVYTAGGSYQVTLTVDDQQGTSCSTDVASTSLRVNSAPIARVSAPVSVCALDPHDPLEVTFDASGSGDPDGDALAYRWDLGDGSAVEGAVVTHQYGRGGRYTATLTVDDGAGTSCSTSTTNVAIQANHAPVASVSPQVAGCPGELVSFDASASHDSDGDLLVYTWDFGDGQTGSGSLVNHEYAAHGDFPVTVTVDDGTGTSCNTATADSRADINAQPVAKIRVRGD